MQQSSGMGRTRGRPPKDRAAEDEEIKTITYDEYVNAGIPDALLQGLDFAESLSGELMDAENPNDDDTKIPDEHLEIPDSVSAAVTEQSTASIIASASVVPVSLIQLLSSNIGNVPLPLLSRSNSELSSSCAAVGSDYSNLVSGTPSAVNLVDKDGKILPSLPAIPGLVGNAEIGEQGGLQAVTYIDENGRVLSQFPCPSQRPADSRPIVRMVDSNGRIISSQMQSNISKPDKGDGVILTTNTPPDVKRNEPTMQRLSSEDGNRSKRTSMSASTDNAVTAKEPTPSIEASARLPGSRQTTRPPNHLLTMPPTTRASNVRSIASAPNHPSTAPVVTVSSRTKGKVRYDRLPTGEVVASIVREAPTDSPQTKVRKVPVDSPPKNPTTKAVASHPAAGREMPEGYPINRSNVASVVEEAHRATQSMRILLCSMREELRRAGGLCSDGSNWTSVQLTQRRNITHRLSVAYQSYRQSIQDIENVQFRSGNPDDDGGESSTGVNSGRTFSRSSDAMVRPSSSFTVGSVMRHVPKARSSGQIIDLTD